MNKYLIIVTTLFLNSLYTSTISSQPLTWEQQFDKAWSKLNNFSSEPFRWEKLVNGVWRKYVFHNHKLGYWDNTVDGKEFKLATPALTKQILDEVSKADEDTQHTGRKSGEFIWHNDKLVWATWELNDNDRTDTVKFESDPRYELTIEEGNKPVTIAEKAASDAKKKIWHRGAWHNAVRTADSPVSAASLRSYISDDSGLISLSDAEMAASKAKKSLWHKGAWHDAVWYNDAMNSYVDGGKIITLTAEELSNQPKK